MKILHLDENHPLLIEQLETAGFQNTKAYTTPKEEVESMLPNFDGIVVRSRFPIDAAFLAHGSRLKFCTGWCWSRKYRPRCRKSNGNKPVRCPHGKRQCRGRARLGHVAQPHE